MFTLILVTTFLCSTHHSLYWCDFESEFTTIGAHRGARGEVCQVCTMGTKGYIMEMEASMVQWKCMEALKVEVLKPVILAQSKKVKGEERRS